MIFWSMLILNHFSKKVIRQKKGTIDLLVPALLSQKYLKNWLSLSKLSKQASLKTAILDMPFKEQMKHWALSKGDNKVGETVMNISKAFQVKSSNSFCRNEKLMVSTQTLQLSSKAILSNRHTIKVDNKFCKCQKISLGVPQGFILALYFPAVFSFCRWPFSFYLKPIFGTM